MRVGDPEGCTRPTAVPAHPTRTHTGPSELRSGPFLPSRLPDLAPIRLLQAPRPTPVRAQNTYPSLPKPQLKPTASTACLSGLPLARSSGGRH